jgi:amino acid adenylation domain-containing protein
MGSFVHIPAICSGPAREDAEWCCVQKLVDDTVARLPEKVGFVCGPRTWTFAEFGKYARAVASRLIALGVGPGDMVGLCAGRSEKTLAGIFGILQTGAAYVPVDPAFPSERLNFTLRDAGVRVVVTESHLHDLLSIEGLAFVDLDEHLPDAPAEFSPYESAPEDLAYVIYTSGSTGQPKGVRIPQRSLVNFAKSMSREPGVGEEDVLLALTTFSFDMCILEVFLPLITGATMVIASDEMRRDGRLLAGEIERTGITLMQGTPGTWRLLRETGWEGRREMKILTGAEPVPRALVNDLAGRCRSLWAMYGPTETTVWSTCVRLEVSDGPVPIGRPIDNTRVYVLNEALQLLPEGEVGELFIGGDGVALGYHGRPELTSEKFVSDPFVPGATIYRTGDLARWSNGTLEFAGRMDSQVKIRGYRVELGEIEHRIEQIPGVRQAVAVLHEGTRLVAYVSGQADLAGVRDGLAESLPSYMVPALILPLEEFPLNANGKVDRIRLARQPLPEVASGAPPRTDWERTLYGIWCDVLGRRDVGCEDNFFEAGGDSIQLGIVHARVSNAAGRDLPVTDLFAHPSIRALARHLEGAAGGNRDAQQRAQMQRQALAARKSSLVRR